MDDSVLPSKLLTDLTLAAEIIRGHDFIHIYSHFDTDGLTAAGIAAKALARAGKEFIVTIFPTLTESQMQVIEEAEDECVLVTDLGASYVKRFDAMKQDVVILDHHTVGDLATRVCYANPHLYGIDGMTSGCGASMSFLFAITLDEKNWDLAPLSIIGMVGDRQHLNGMSGINSHIFAEASKRGMVKTMQGSLIPYGNISTELYMSTEPFIKGVSGDSDGTRRFLEEAGIGPDKNLSNLTPEESIKLSSMIAVKLIEQGVTRDKLEECARTRYYLPSWGTDAETMSSVINACGRQEQPGVGVSVCLGDGSALEQAKYIDADSRKKVMDAVCDIVNKSKIQEMEHIVWFDSSDSGYTGMLCGVVMSFLGNPNKPTIGVNCSESMAKASSRGTFPLLDRGVDLADAMKRGCASVGGEGGGHRIAAGGSFDSARHDEFLKNVDKIVGEQISKH
ncbi:ssDNA exonuclease RecJ1 [methanogenic archaeon ISO4-H5]|nr:ssDNA exonuclease RecJ1 [methanogenic archaeon ISO4-H5]